MTRSAVVLVAVFVAVGATAGAQERERSDWDDNLRPSMGCLLFPTSYWAARGEVKVTKVEGKSRIRPGDTQTILPGSFRLDQFSEARERFGCEMLFAFVANQLRGDVVEARAELRTVVIGKLLEATLVTRGNDLDVIVIGTAEPGTRITREGKVHGLPLGVKDDAELKQFGAMMSARLSEVMRKLPRGKSPRAAVVGSCVKGRAAVVGSCVKGRAAGNPDKGKKPGVPFDGKDEPSDIDALVVSVELFEEGKRLGCNDYPAGKDDAGRDVRRLSENCEELEGRKRISAGHPELTRMREELSKLLTPNVPPKFRGAPRPVNYVVANGRPARLSALDVPGL